MSDSKAKSTNTTSKPSSGGTRQSSSGRGSAPGVQARPGSDGGGKPAAPKNILVKLGSPPPKKSGGGG